MADAFETILVAWLAFASLPERPTRSQGGTDGSNPLSSSGESGANAQVSSMAAAMIRISAIGTAGSRPPSCSESGSEIDFNRLAVYEAGGLLVTLGLPREDMAIDLLRSTRKADPSATARPLRELTDTRRKATCASWWLAPARPAGISADAWPRPDGT